MATKNNPGEFDCYAAAHPDEPLFVLRSTDPIAPLLVRIWAALRAQDYVAARHYYEKAADLSADRRRKVDDKFYEAWQCADDMIKWRAENDNQPAR